MDSLDIRLLRAMFRGRRLTLRGVDPRGSVQELAREVRVSRITVSRRLARWRSDGFWKGVAVFPNPGALGIRFQIQGVVLDGGRNRERLEIALQEVLEPLFVFQVEDLYGALLLAEPAEVSARRQSAFRKACGCRRISGPFEVAFPPIGVRLGPRDWRLLRSLRRSPEPEWTRVAVELGMTVRGLKRRVGRLLESEAIFFFPLVDFRRLRSSIACVGVTFRKGVEPMSLLARIAQGHPDLLSLDPILPLDSAVRRVPSERRPALGGGLLLFLPVPSGSSADDLRRELAHSPGVVDVVVGFPTQNLSFPRRLDSLIAEALGESMAEPPTGSVPGPARAAA
jgi:DNA-binding Lrp family transcriptional regulator